MSATFDIPLLEAIFELVARHDWTADQLAAHRRDALRSTLVHASDHSPWHRARLADADLDAGFDDGDLATLPTMTKVDLMQHWDSIVTDSRLTLSGARAHLEQVDRSGFAMWHDEYLVFTTGGTTGQQGIFCWSKAEMARWGASSARWGASDGLGPPARQVFVGARSYRHPSGVAALLTSGDPGLAVPIDQPVEAVIERINALQPDALAVVCSYLPLLLDAAEAGRLRIPLERLSVFGDVLDPKCRARALAAFGVELCEGYPTTDVGYIAHEAPGQSGLIVNDDLMIVEAVDCNEQPVPRGTLCDHLLVTSLHQRTLPLIRYRIDDRVQFAESAERYPGFSRIAHIDGRSDDLFDYGGAVVHPHGLRSALSASAAVRDYVVRQTTSGAQVEVVAEGPLDTGALAGDLQRVFSDAGIADASVQVVVVRELDRTAMGKRLRFVPLREQGI